MSSTLINSSSQAFGTSAGTITASFTLAVGDLILAHGVGANPASGISLSDTLGTPNTYTNEVQSAATGETTALIYSLVTHAGACQFTFSSTGGNVDGISVFQWRATNGYSGIMGTPVGGIFVGGGYAGANILTSSGFTTPSLITTGNALLFATCWDQGLSAVVLTAGTSPTAYTLQGTDWTNWVAEESAEAVGSVTTVVTFGNNISGYDNFHILGIAVGETTSGTARQQTLSMLGCGT